jgi:hypothetical protein
MPKVFMWPVDNDDGRELLRHVQEIAGDLGAQLDVALPTDDRRRLWAALRDYDAVICDGSVEPGHIYHSYLELTKANNHLALCSRTPLPRNVYAFHQCAPTHGQVFDNETLGHWLADTLPVIFDGHHAQRGYWGRMSSSLHEMKTQVGSRVGVFVSYRGRFYDQVQRQAMNLSAGIGLPVRVVPKGEFAYETECMSRQRMWATVALFEREISWGQDFLIVYSDDYLESFWTTAELFAALYFHPERHVDDRVWLAGEDALTPTEPSFHPLPVEPPSGDQRKEYRRLLRQADPGVVAPEMRRERNGLAGLFFSAVYRLTGHAAAPGDDRWWSEVLVPCPHCRPHRRVAGTLDWSAHLQLEGYGYFSISRSCLDGERVATVRCPGCDAEVKLVNRRPPRTLWVPGPLGRPWPKTMQVIDEEPVWEVEHEATLGPASSAATDQSNPTDFHRVG